VGGVEDLLNPGGECGCLQPPSSVREMNDPAPRDEKADHYDRGDHEPNDGHAGQSGSSVGVLEV